MKNGKRLPSLLLALALLCAAGAATADSISRAYPVHRRLVQGCRGEDVLCVAQKLYELGYLSAAPSADDPGAAVYNAAMAAAVQKYEKQYYIAPESVAPLTSPDPELIAEVIFIEAVDGELTQEEQLGLLRVDPLLPAPEGVRLRADKGKVDITWSKVARALSYNVYRDDKLLGSTTDARWTDEGAAQGAVHRYRVATCTYSTEVSSAEESTLLPYYYQTLKYNDLQRSPDAYVGQYIGLSRVSVVAQLSADDANDALLVVRGSSTCYYMVLLKGFFSGDYWSDTIPVTRFLENDKITINGRVLGTATFTTDSHEKLTIPYLQSMELTLY